MLIWLNQSNFPNSQNKNKKLDLLNVSLDYYKIFPNSEKSWEIFFFFFYFDLIFFQIVKIVIQASCASRKKGNPFHDKVEVFEKNKC